MDTSSSWSRASPLDSLPDELLQRIFHYVPDTDLMLALPLVCKTFSRVAKSPSDRWSNLEYSRLFDFRNPNWINAGILCNWLRPRIAKLRWFNCPVDTLKLQDDGCLTQELLSLLPISLQHLSLQCDARDALHAAPRATRYGIETRYHASQDVAPHVSALARLSNLKQLAVPLHTPLDSASLDSLTALRSLGSLQLEWRCSESLLGPAGLPDSSCLSRLISLTNLEITGCNGLSVNGLALLPYLKALCVTACARLHFAGLEASSSLESLVLNDMALAVPVTVIRHALHGLPRLKHLTLKTLSIPQDAGTLQLASLLQLPSLQELTVINCWDIDYEMQLPPGVSGHLSRLRMDVEPGDDVYWSGMVLLLNLKHLQLEVSDEPHYAVPYSLSTLSCLESLQVSCPFREGSDQELDITALGNLGPAVQSIALVGLKRLVVTRSLVPLAALPKLRFVCLGTSGNESSVSPEGDTWIHIAALLQALYRRPFHGLPVVEVHPNLARF